MFDLINFGKYLIGVLFGFIVGFLFKCYLVEKAKEKLKLNGKKETIEEGFNKPQPPS